LLIVRLLLLIALLIRILNYLNAGILIVAHIIYYFYLTFHACIDLAIIKVLSTLMYSNLKHIILLKNRTLSIKILKCNNMWTIWQMIEWRLIFFNWVIAYLPFNNWAFFNFQITRMKLVVFYQDLIRLCLIFLSCSGRLWLDNSWNCWTLLNWLLVFWFFIFGWGSDFNFIWRF